MEATFVDDVLETVQRVAAFAKAVRRTARNIEEVEREIDERLHRTLMTLQPDAVWFSEENRGSERVPGTGPAWLVDAIDGTKDFVSGRPGWAVSVCLLTDGRPQLGVLVAPDRRETWHAVRGGGAQLNYRPIACSTQSSLAGARIAANAVWRRDGDLICVGRPYSIALRIAMVASGDADLASSYSDIHVWDIAAALLIAMEAGALVSTAVNRPIGLIGESGEVPSLVVANPWLHRQMLDRIALHRERKEPGCG